MNAHDKSQDGTAKPARQAHGMIGKLQAVDRRITPQHVARRWRALLDDIGDSSTSPPAACENAEDGRPAATAGGKSNGGAPTGQLVSLQSLPGKLAETDGLLRDPEAAYRTSTTAAAAGVTSRQLAYWARTGLVEPSVRAARGSGSQRLYSFHDVLVLKTVKRLLDTGISLQQIRVAVQHLRDHATEDLAQITLMSDGATVYECTSPDEVVDLLAGGHAIFGIALGQVWQEVTRELAGLPAKQAADSTRHDADEVRTSA